jgi:putative transposase
VRYGYRKIRVLLTREGWAVGKHLVYRLYREEGLTLRHRPPRRRKAVVPRAHRPSVTTPNDAWTLDFVTDQLTNGQQIRALTVMDVWTRESLAIEVGQHLRSEHVVQVLNRLTAQRGAPKRLFCDNVLYPEVKSHKRKNLRSAALGSCETIPLLPSQWASTS